MALLIGMMATAQPEMPSSPNIVHLQNAEGRHSISLDGKWQAIADPLETGFYIHRFQERKDGFFINQKMKDSSDLVEYDFDKSPLLDVPGDWNTQMEKLYLYEGTVWYKKDFTLHKKQGRLYFIHFGAVNYQAIVYINGKKAGLHNGGYTSFDLDITEWLKEGANWVVVKVENKRKPDRIPTVNMDWWNYGGITRSVSLVETPATYIGDYFITLSDPVKGGLHGWVQLEGDRKAGNTVELDIDGLGIHNRLRTDDQGRASFAIPAKPVLWTPENPNRYAVSWQMDGDTLADKIGFRTIAVNGDHILLNGKPVFLRGISIHAEAPFHPGRVTTEAQCRVLLTWAKELGCNFVRLAHYPHSTDMVKLADEMGLMVWSEIPVYWTVLFDKPEVYELAQDQLEEMIARDKNRASIVLWSVANETPNEPARLEFLKKLVSRARELDSSRLITAALFSHTDKDGFQMISDPLGADLDVIGINNYCGWYGGKPSSCGAVRWKSAYQKPVIMSEMGGGALQGMHGDSTDRWTEEYQDAVYRNNLEMLTHIPFLRGASPWILTDFLSPRRLLPGIQDDYNRKGLISGRGIRKQAFYTLQEFYRKLATGELKMQ